MGLGVFDTVAIRQSCWQTCDRDPGAFPMDLGDLPAYRDDDTRKQFYEVGTFFGCVDLCESEYEWKRYALIAAPIAAAVFLLLLLLLSCCFCKCCLLYRWRQRRNKESNLQTSSQASSASTLDLSSAAPTVQHALPPSYNSALTQSQKFYLPKLGSTNQKAAANQASTNQRQPRRRLLEQPPQDMNASLRSNVSVNSWVQDAAVASSAGFGGSASARGGFMSTASKLGRRLVRMDQQSGEERNQRRHRPGRNRGGAGAGADSPKKKSSSSSKNAGSGLDSSRTGVDNPPMRF